MRNGRLPERPSVWLLYWPIERRHRVEAWRWVIRGSRLLSRFPVTTRYRARSRQVLRHALKRLPSRLITSEPLKSTPFALCRVR